MVNRLSRGLVSRIYFCVVWTGVACCQTPVPPEVPEMTAQEQPAIFKARVNLVFVPVVVRDSQGHAVGTYKVEDFQLFDKGRLQKTLDVKWKDRTLEPVRAAGVSVKSTFSVPPGTYVVRLVGGDSEGQDVSALNSAVAMQ